jgi:acetylornithine deacetylase/succinyl-diaminopimelate desuccinylase-like protein
MSKEYSLSAIARLMAEPAIAAQRARLTALSDRTLEEAITIQQIAAPTFDEHRRAEYVYSRFKAEGLDSLEIDAVQNVYGRLAGTTTQQSGQLGILISAHTDTVFDIDTPLDIKRDGNRVYGAGVGDNSLGVAALLTLVGVLREQRLPADIWFVANSREEGLGDLGGMRAAHEKLAPRVKAALVIEGIAFGRVYHAGIAVRRLEISCRTPGGHSWLHFGRPSAIHTLLKLGTQITAIVPPISPRTTYNIGVISGGRSVNSIASDASLLLDLRSEDRGALAALENEVLALIESNRAEEVEFSVKVVGDRPAGSIPLSHPLVQLADEVMKSIAVKPIYEAGSTDANIPLAYGLPAITVGVTYGGNAHRIDEYLETTNIPEGLWQLFLLATAAAMGLAG